MPSPETVELRQRPDDQLREELEEAHQALFNLRFQAATRQLADVSQVRKAKRRIARIKTLLREHDIVAVAEREAPEETAGETAENGAGALDDGAGGESDAAEAEGDAAAGEE